jgi:tight adherence protein C
MLILVMALLLLGTAAALVVRAVAMPRMRTSATLGQIDDYGYATRRASSAGTAHPSAVRRRVDSLAQRVGIFLASRVRGMREADVRLELMAAGIYDIPAKRFMGYRALAAVSVPVVAAWAAVTAGLSPGLLLLVLPAGVAAGWSAPMVVVRRRSRRRLERIDYDLPELIDLLVVTVEAGMGFNGSLQIAAGHLEGPLGEELRLAVQEQSMGLSSHEALRNLLARAETPATRSFVRAGLQGDTLGVSIGQILRNLAIEMRSRRRAAAEDRAQKAPVKMLFPLVFLIFPAMFVVLLAPALFGFLEAIGGTG